MIDNSSSVFIKTNLEKSHAKKAMPDKFKDSDVITAYRNYYIGDKIYRSDGRIMMVYTNRLPPIWLMDVFQFSYNEKFNQYKVNLQKAERVS